MFKSDDYKESGEDEEFHPMSTSLLKTAALPDTLKAGKATSNATSTLKSKMFSPQSTLAEKLREAQGQGHDVSGITQSLTTTGLMDKIDQSAGSGWIVVAPLKTAAMSTKATELHVARDTTEESQGHIMSTTEGFRTGSVTDKLWKPSFKMLKTAATFDTKNGIRTGWLRVAGKRTPATSFTDFAEKHGGDIAGDIPTSHPAYEERAMVSAHLENESTTNPAQRYTGAGSAAYVVGTGFFKTSAGGRGTILYVDRPLV